MTITIPITDYQGASLTLGANPEAEAAALAQSYDCGEITRVAMVSLLTQLIALATPEDK